MNLTALSKDYRVVDAATVDFEELYALYRSNQSYFDYFSLDPTKDRLVRDITMLPDGCTEEQKHFLAYCDNEKPVAILDLIEGYPDNKTCYIGLFMVRRELHGQGVGTSIITQLCRALAEHGYESLRLAYGKRFASAKSFWSKNAFEPIKEATLEEYGELIVAQRRLPHSDADKPILTKPFTDKDYEAVCDFLIGLGRNNNDHINWNWARFEWMYEHPEFDKSARSSIGLWTKGDRVVGAAIYDMYFGEAFCGALPGYEELYPDILDYAYKNLKDNAGLGVSVCDDRIKEIKALEKAGFIVADQTETVMVKELNEAPAPLLPEGFRFVELDPEKDAYDLQWLFWQGFDHGTDRAQFERSEEIIPRIRPHFDRRLSIAAQDKTGENAAYCCLWYSDKTDYAYVEPVCTVPSRRGKGLAKAVVYEALGRARRLGAKKAYVISDTVFYEKLGFKKEKHFSFYWKKEEKSL